MENNEKMNKSSVWFFAEWASILFTVYGNEVYKMTQETEK